MSLKHPRTILVALDSSPRASLVLAEGVDLAQKLGGSLVLVRAIGLHHAIPVEALNESPTRVPEILERNDREELEQQAREAPPGLVAKVVVHVGVAWEVICRTADEENADLIVIGSHGYSGIDKLLGTTAAKVVNHTRRSVLVVREKPTD
ncbi:universal stress protein [Sorangium cellulosum]|uniref:Universal stress protein n=1 Tax=Sorangium cellulosum TaxID=56 RepID=A0A2L0F9M9_SORCE|nr:universal stress protein [Sorangium cellulosum]AUX48288.1 universal stress protein [Sorangium cellulosum]